MTTINVPLKWFHYNQNNSGGYLIVNDDVAEDVFIQAPSAAEAEERAEAIFAEYSEYCECCGRRWSTGYMDDDDGYDVPCLYGTPITEETASTYRNQARLHYYDGRIVIPRDDVAIRMPTIAEDDVAIRMPTIAEDDVEKTYAIYRALLDRVPRVYDDALARARKVYIDAVESI
jgi:hypothetical protein